MPANTNIEIVKLPTDRPDYFVRVSLTYNDGSMRRASRGYDVSVYVIKEDGWSWTTHPLGRENTRLNVEHCDRFSRKRFEEIAACLRIEHHALRLPVERAIDNALALAPTVNI